MDINETFIRKFPTFSKKIPKRRNYFEILSDTNQTHAKCGEKSLKKSCSWYAVEKDENNNAISIICEGQERPIIYLDICYAFDFIEAKGYNESDINEARRSFFETMNESKFQNEKYCFYTM